MAAGRYSARERCDTWVGTLRPVGIDGRKIGVQLLTGFLLTLPFQSRFQELYSLSRRCCLITLSAAVLSTGFLVGPVSLRRFLFRRYARRITVAVARRLAQIGMALLAIAIVTMVLLIFDVASGIVPGVAAAVAAALLVAGLWEALPWRCASGEDERDDSVREGRR